MTGGSRVEHFGEDYIISRARSPLIFTEYISLASEYNELAGGYKKNLGFRDRGRHNIVGVVLKSYTEQESSQIVISVRVNALK